MWNFVIRTRSTRVLMHIDPFIITIFALLTLFNCIKGFMAWNCVMEVPWPWEKTFHADPFRHKVQSERSEMWNRLCIRFAFPCEFEVWTREGQPVRTPSIQAAECSSDISCSSIFTSQYLQCTVPHLPINVLWQFSLEKVRITSKHDESKKASILVSISSGNSI